MTASSAVADAVDPRRITEHDPDVARLRVYWTRRLMASLRRFQQEVKWGGELAIGPAQNAFIHRHIDLLRAAYLAGHREGQRDYWDEVSAEPQRWARRNRVAPSEALVQKRLMFYGAASVVKLARELAMVYRSNYTSQGTLAGSSAGSSLSQHDDTQTLADPPADLTFDKFTLWAQPRVGLQADVTWSGFQDGYIESAATDAAGLTLRLWWDLEPSAKHCEDCPRYAAGSPYDAPGSAASGGNELNATPGDGHTACGASCKCGLSYGWWNNVAGEEILGSVGPLGPMTVSHLPAANTPLRDLTAGQRKALDAIRGATVQWEQVRGSLPRLSAFDGVASLDWANVDEAMLSTKQWAVLEQYLTGLNEWNEHTSF